MGQVYVRVYPHGDSEAEDVRPFNTAIGTSIFPDSSALASAAPMSISLLNNYYARNTVCLLKSTMRPSVDPTRPHRVTECPKLLGSFRLET